MVDITLLEDRIFLHSATGPVELPLAYQVHSRLIQTGELARLLAEHLREEAAGSLPSSGEPVRLALPLQWGLLCLRLPQGGVEELAQPLHQIAWEIEANAPEAVEQYAFDFQECECGDGDRETRILAVRNSLVHFCQTLLDELGLRLAEVVPAGESGAGFRLELSRARAHQEALALEQFAPVTSWRRLLVLGGLGLTLALAGILWSLLRDDSPRQPTAVVVPPVAADSLRASLRTDSPVHADSSTTPLPATANPAALQAWVALLQELVASEDRLPDWFMLDGQGALVRVQGRGEANLRELLTRPARSTRAGRTGYWLSFTTPLAGGAWPEDPSRAVQRLDVIRLAELAPRLREAPARLILQRRHGEGALLTTRWRVSSENRGEPHGWRVIVFPGRPQLQGGH